MKFGDLLVPWASCGPWQSRLGPSRAPSWPEVAIFDEIWGHFGVTLELILLTVGVSFDACRLQELKKAGSGRHSEPESFSSSMLGSAPRCSGGFSLQRELCFNFGGQWQTMSSFGSIWRDLGSLNLNYTHFGVSLRRFWVGK